MTKLILSTANVMGSGNTVARRTLNQKSNVEFTAGLRANFAAAQHAAQHEYANAQKSNGTSEAALVDPHTYNPKYTEWTESSGDTLYVPKLSFDHSGLSEEQDSYEITVKLFFLPSVAASSRCVQARQAVDMVLKELHVSKINLLIVSYPGMSFDAESGQLEDDSADPEVKPEDVDTMIETWRCFEDLYDQKLISKLGVAEFSTERLSAFLQKARVKPQVNQINVKDCCIVPKPLILFAKENHVELLTHNDCTNILPSGTTRELLDHDPRGARVLADANGKDGLVGQVFPQWVIKYTAVVKDRGVVENKGYFALAELQGHH